MSENKIMTTKELAVYIKMNEKTVLKMAQEGKIPGVKIGAQWRFHLDSIDAYLQKDIIKSSDQKLDLIINTRIDVIPLSRLIREDLILLETTAKTSDEILDALVDTAVASGLTSAEKKLKNELRNREKMLSTAVGHGVAVPHPRHPSKEFFENTNIILARLSRGIDFKAPDNKPVHLFFMTCAPNEFVHLRLLAIISKLLHQPSIVKKFFKVTDKASVIQLLMEFEREHIFPITKIRKGDRSS